MLLNSLRGATLFHSLKIPGVQYQFSLCHMSYLFVLYLSTMLQVIKDYIPKISKTKHLVYIRSLCGSKFGELEPSTYDRVLVDAPCSLDRHNLHTNFEFSLWSIKRSKAKAKSQKMLLASAMQTVVPGGIVVYSTCSLSPFENDGVIDEVLSQFSESDQLKVSVLDVDFTSHSLTQMFNYRLTRFGTLILPSRTKNWGPMYICKLQRVASESETKSHEVITSADVYAANARAYYSNQQESQKSQAVGPLLRPKSVNPKDFHFLN